MTQAIQEHSVVAIYNTHVEAEAAIRLLQHAGLDMKQLSIVGQDFHTEEQALGFYTSGDRMKFWGGQGVLWGSLWGMLFGSAFFLIPGVGPIVVMGPLVGWFVGALEGAALGGAVGVFGAALASIGVPADSVVKYTQEIETGKFLVLARGNAAMTEQSRSVLGTTKATTLDTHSSEQGGFRES
jgi:hypothetical protein